ncbi:dTMP kinase [Pseudomonas sp. R16(2017)]|uniref:dTMP kinase n=1 Tax=Pseudomonas sp. R16(2017) TaxID=1981704 RepID=UPI000A1DEB18|nr:dTMP kinase [Pseudomonas sp. R16(2017)]
MKGKFIVFEGIDGSGTSTQSELLKKALIAKGKLVHLTCEPSNGPIGDLIRQIFKGRVAMPKGTNPVDSADLFDEQMAYLFAADRHDHLYNAVDGVYNLLNKGYTVISTRYFFSSYAYHCNDATDLTFVESLNKKFPNPDLVIYLDNPIDVSEDRINQRVFKDEYENNKKLAQARNNYQSTFSTYTGNLLILNATDDVYSIHQKILERTELSFEN